MTETDRHDDVAPAKRDATPAELALEDEGTLAVLALGELGASELTQALAQAELEYRRDRTVRLR